MKKGGFIKMNDIKNLVLINKNNGELKRKKDIDDIDSDLYCATACGEESILAVDIDNPEQYFTNSYRGKEIDLKSVVFKPMQGMYLALYYNLETNDNKDVINATVIGSTSLDDLK